MQFQLFNGNIKTHVVFAVIEPLAPRIFNQYGRSASNSIDPSVDPFSFMAKPNVSSHANAEVACGPFPLGDQVMAVLGMTEQATGNVLETTLTAGTVVPKKHLQQMHQFVFTDALHRFEPIGTSQSRDRDRSIDIIKRLEQQGG